jgi:hypothetical protein
MMGKKKSQRGGRRKGAGRKPTVLDPVKISFLVEREDADALDQFARRKGVPLSEYARRLVHRHVERKRTKR